MIDQTLDVSQQSLSASFNELAKLYCAQQKYEEAESLYTRALAIDEVAFGKDHLDLVPSLMRLGIVFRIQEKFAQAEPLYLRALEITQKHCAADGLEVAYRLNYLAGLANARGDFAGAESLINRSVAIYEKRLGKDASIVGIAYLSLALVKRRLGHDEQADRLFDQFVENRQKNAQSTDDGMLLAEMFYRQGRYDDAELVFRYALLLGEEKLWPNHPFVAIALNGFARWYVAQQNYEKAVPLYARVLDITEKLMGPKHPSIEPILKNYATALQNCDRVAEAEEVLKRADQIRQEQHFPTKVATVIGERYLIIELLGKGGMSTVYKARHQLTNKIVAVKMLNLDYLADKTSFSRFHLEAKTASALNHPNVVAVHDFGSTPEGVPYIVMDFLEGKDLRDTLKESGALPLDKATAIFLQCCDALSAAHEQGVVHRDLKPGNIMLTSQHGEKDIVKIVDLGIAKVMATSNVGALSLTQTGEVFGSPSYMSPEQSRGGQIDLRSDIYSLGCVMYEVLTGSPPFSGDNALEVLHRHLSDDPVPIATSHPHILGARDLDKIVLRCLSKDPDMRFQSMKEIKQAIEALRLSMPTAAAAGVATNPSRFRPRMGIAVAAAAALVATIGGGWQVGHLMALSRSPAPIASAAGTAPIVVAPAETGNAAPPLDSTKAAALSKVRRMVSLARVCHANGQCNEAEVFLKDALNLSEEVFGKDSSEATARVRDLALFYQSLDQTDKAAPYLERLLRSKGAG